MKKNGFSIIEMLIVVAIIGVLAVIGTKVINTVHETRLVRCNQDIMAMRTIVEQAREQTPGRRTPTREEVMAVADGRWDDHYWYVKNNSDANKGHGNDLDFCDEENPSGKLNHVGGVCYDIEFIIMCDHDHSRAEADMVAIIDASNLPMGPMVFSGNPEHRFVKDLTYWEEISTGKQPNLRKWWGR